MQTHQITPLQIAGNTTEDQHELLREALAEAASRIHKSALKKLDRQAAGLVLELDAKLKAEVVTAALKVIQRLTVSDKYMSEEAVSRREYPPTYRVRPIEAQVAELQTIFPELTHCTEKIARLPLPEGAEGWFAIPRWQSVAPTYSEALGFVLEALSSRRRFSNRVVNKLGNEYLRQNERTRYAESLLAEQQPGCDILVMAAQAGMLHRGCSARRARIVMEGNEFGLGSFALGCMLLTHPDRLAHVDALMIDCSGDEYSFLGNGDFDRVPLFDYDLGGIEFSVFYEDRARNLWGTPSGFLFHMPEGRKLRAEPVRRPVTTAQR